MGTRVTITAVARKRRQTNEAVQAAFTEIARIDRLLSTYREDSEISLLNRDKVLLNPSPELTDNIRKSLSYSRLTGGAFDITVGPMLELYNRTLVELQREPTEDERKQALSLIDYRLVNAGTDQITIGPNQQITLGGIAKGYAVDRAGEILRNRGVVDAIVEAGGDLLVMGKKSADRDWHIAIQNPRDPGDYIARVNAPDRAVVTSGDYERYYNSSKTYHHIINPLTGLSATQLISVTLIARSAFEGDVLSTSVFVLGKERGLELVESLDDVEALIITRSREVIRSSGWDRFETEP